MDYEIIFSPARILYKKQENRLPYWQKKRWYKKIGKILVAENMSAVKKSVKMTKI